MVLMRGFLRLVFNVMMTLMLVLPMLEVAEARVSVANRLSNGISKLKYRLLPKTTGEHSAFQKLIAGAGMMLVVCTTGSLVSSCSGKKMIHSSEPLLVAQFSAAELEVGEYVHVRIDGNRYTASIIAHESDGGIKVELFPEGFAEEGGIERIITADKVKGRIDQFHADNGKQVLISGIELEKASVSVEDAQRVSLQGFADADTIYWHGIITTMFSDGSMEVMIGAKIYVHHQNGEHEQMVTMLTEPVFTIVGKDDLAAPPYQ